MSSKNDDEERRRSGEFDRRDAAGVLTKKLPLTV
jgi:hypothetical protein